MNPAAHLGRLGVAAIALLTLLAGSLIAASSSQAAKPLDIGFADNLYGIAGKSEKAFKLTQSMNADIIRVNMYWCIAARTQPADPRDPGDPAYNWTEFDEAIAGATAHGFEVELTITCAPPWAEGPNRPSQEKAPFGSWKPDPAKFGDFAHAAAVRYSGAYDPAVGPQPSGGGGSGVGGVVPPIIPLPAAAAARYSVTDQAGGPPTLQRAGALPAIKYFEAWNEPNLSTYITPQWEGKQNTASDIYVDLLNEFYDEVKAVNPSAQIVTGGTAPYGDPPGGPNRTQPIRFYQELFCLNTKNKPSGSCPNGKAPKFDIVAHHPINREDPPTAKAINKGDVEIADFGSLVKVVRAAEKAGTLATPGRHDVWANEVWWQTNPPDKQEGVSYKTHARWTQQALYLLWKQGATNVTFLQLYDKKYTPGESTLASYQTGAFTFKGKRKPTADAVAFPFVTDDKGKGVLGWGRAPESGKLTIEVKGKGGYEKLTTLNVKAGKIFTKKLRLKGDGKQVLRAKVGGETSVPWAHK